MTPTEALLHQIRDALGPHNDPHEDAIALIRNMRQDLYLARDEIDRLRLDIAFLQHGVQP